MFEAFYKCFNKTFILFEKVSLTATNYILKVWTDYGKPFTFGVIEKIRNFILESFILIRTL